MFRAPVPCVPLLIGLMLALAPARAAGPELAPDDPLWTDQVADPGESEDPELHLEEHPNLAFTTPEQVVSYVQDTLEQPWEWSADSPNLVVVRNAGAGYRPGPGEAAYDDLFLVVTPTRVVQFTYGNAEGTEHRTYVKKYGYDRFADPEAGKGMTPALAPGRYRFLVGKHRDQYKALRVTTWDYQRDGLPSQRRNGKRGAFAVGAVNVHKGGSTWNWSVGCLTVHYSRYQDFIDRFRMGTWGSMYVLGDWDGPPPQSTMLAEAGPGRRQALFEALEARHGLW